ncbi:MAG: asparagine synthase-related protein [Candidatus Methanofastidiosia archaeon]|jgi:asparagine synthase (glutamine-hydrolysing)
MRICGGPHLEKMAAAMGIQPVYTNTMACSHISGVHEGLVCDADIYHAHAPAQYLYQVIEQCLRQGQHPVQAIRSIHKEVKGGYACAWNHGTCTYLFRDPVGIKPLYYKGSEFASEKKAFTTPPHTVLPGEVVTIPGGPLFRTVITPVKGAPTALDCLDALKKSVHTCVEKKAGILFSGGIDSCIIAALSNTVLVTCGVEHSHDVVCARKAAQLLNKDLIEVIITKKEIEEAVPYIISIIGHKKLLDVEIGLLLYFVCQHCTKKILVSGQGADELFGGYYKYEQAFRAKKDVRAHMNRDLSRIYTGLERDNHIAEHFKNRVRYPYLDLQVIKVALGVSTETLFVPQRKAFLRNVARYISLPPQLVSRPKKALQYGSGIHKIVRKMNLTHY